ncbi:MAG: nuclear transport factor 2 family protein [Alphaproteobacteria bacterium]|jgi:hypothetical protein|nr:nuclear transport factor 2 family protein [Alphaproteobacteria bacterium]MDP6816226.1 nuclear transport factor 2 family protein [Alphaproteobacteria bacterium]
MSNDVEARLAALEARVGELADIEAIRRLRNRYHECINDGLYDEIPLLFAEDGELDFSYIGKATGRAVLTKFFAATPKVLPFIKQFIHNHIVTVDGDRATGVSYMEARTINEGRAFNVSGRYDDICVREADGWKFKSMIFDAYYTVPFDEGWAQDDRLKMARRKDK